MPNILIIDKDTDVLRLLRAKLHAAGYEVAPAISGQAAWNEISTRRPDIVVLELLLPDVDGLALVNDLKTKIEPAPVVVVVTSKAGDDDIKAAFARGADEFVSKPFSPTALLERIRIRLLKLELQTESSEG